ncbi:MAG: GYD domain-containing protein [Methanomassiliicoccales archaeon]|nr:GYD domain-containing protein [Methanomassiliicoccales archaeon]NYT15793.1 GYD domain-containing protein [Methanomassiliicoccales archaeon]
MRFISLIRFKEKPTKESIEKNIECIKHESKKDDVDILEMYWTLGRFDAVVIMEAPDEKTALQSALRRGDCMSTETLVAIPVEEARRLVKK